MGIILSECYVRAREIGGFPASLKLAKLTLCGSQDAKEMPDTPEMVAKFRSAMQKVEAQFLGSEYSKTRQT